MMEQVSLNSPFLLFLTIFDKFQNKQAMHKEKKVNSRGSFIGIVSNL